MCEQDVPCDLIILDILLPRLSDHEVFRQLRASRRRVSILIPTALGSIEDRVLGLDMGADNYLTKLFDFWELEARVSALFRRSGSSQTSYTSHLRDHS